MFVEVTVVTAALAIFEMAVEPSPSMLPLAVILPLTVREVRVPSDVTLPCAAVWSVPVRSVADRFPVPELYVKALESDFSA